MTVTGSFSAGEVAAVRAAAGGLAVVERSELSRWTHLPLCVLDAVFSIGVRYGGTKKVCHRFADYAELPDPVLLSAAADQVIGTAREVPVDVLADLGNHLTPERVAGEVLGNRGRTSTRGGILKADAALRYARILAGAGVHTLGDVAALLHDTDRLPTVEQNLRAVPGNGAHDIRLNYLWMVAGDDQHIKPDRMILRWLAAQLGHPVTTAAATLLVTDVAGQLGHTPWALDHAIWRAQSGRPRSTAKPPNSAS